MGVEATTIRCGQCGLDGHGNFCSGCGQPFPGRPPGQDGGFLGHLVGLLWTPLARLGGMLGTLARLTFTPRRFFAAHFRDSRTVPGRAQAPLVFLIGAIGVVATAQLTNPMVLQADALWVQELLAMQEAAAAATGMVLPAIDPAAPAYLPATGIGALDGMLKELELLLPVLAFAWLAARFIAGGRSDAVSRLFAYLFGGAALANGCGTAIQNLLSVLAIPADAGIAEAMPMYMEIGAPVGIAAGLLALHLMLLVPMLVLPREFGVSRRRVFFSLVGAGLVVGAIYQALTVLIWVQRFDGIVPGGAFG